MQFKEDTGEFSKKNWKRKELGAWLLKKDGKQEAPTKGTRVADRTEENGVTTVHELVGLVHQEDQTETHPYTSDTQKDESNTDHLLWCWSEVSFSFTKTLVFCYW